MRVKLFILKAAQVKISKALFSLVTDLLPNIAARMHQRSSLSRINVPENVFPRRRRRRHQVRPAKKKQRKMNARDIINNERNVRASKWAVNYIFISARGEVHKSLVLTKFIASRRILIRIHRCDFYDGFTTIALVAQLEIIGERDDFSKSAARTKLYAVRFRVTESVPLVIPLDVH